MKLIRITTVPQSLKTLLKGQLQFMAAKGFEVLGVSSRGKDLEEVRENEGVDVMPLEMTRTISPLKDLRSLWSFYKLCKTHKPTIVHSHTPKAGIVGMLGAKLAGVPIRLHTVAGLPLMEASGVKRKLLDFVERVTYRSATKVYPNSQGLYDFILQNKYTNKNKLKVIASGSSNGIDTSFFSKECVSKEAQLELKQRLNIQPEDFVFVFVGRLVGDKGVNELVNAFLSLAKGETKLLLVGPLEAELDPLSPETLSAIENNPNIFAVGSQRDVRPYFAISDALVFPSYREGFPNVVMQAGAMELPSIVSDINGCNEIIVEGKNGLIIPVKNTDILKQKMLELSEDIDLYSDLKSNARYMISSRYEQRAVWEALLAEYKILCLDVNKN